MPYAHPQQKRLGIYYNVPVMICIMPQSPAEADAEGAASHPTGLVKRYPSYITDSSFFESEGRILHHSLAQEDKCPIELADAPIVGLCNPCVLCFHYHNTHFAWELFNVHFTSHPRSTSKFHTLCHSLFSVNKLQPYPPLATFLYYYFCCCCFCHTTTPLLEPNVEDV